MYKMAKNAIDKGSRDTLDDPSEAHRGGARGDREQQRRPAQRRADGGRGGGGGGAPVAIYNSVLHDPKVRDPRGFILPSDQPDFLTATKFVNTLIKAGVVVHRATAPFTVAGKQYPAGSLRRQGGAAVPRARDGHVRAAGSPGRHPVSGRPAAPAVRRHRLQHRLLDGRSSSIASSTAFDGPFEKIADVVAGAAGQGRRRRRSRRRLPAQPPGERRVRRRQPAAEGERRGLLAASRRRASNGKTYPAGTMFIPAKASTLPILQKLAADKGLSFDAVASRPAGDAMKLKPVRIGLWDQYGGSMPSGWTRWLFEQYEFPFEVVYPADARRRQPEREVRRAGVRRRRHPDARRAAGGGGFGGAAGGGHDPGGVPRPARPRHRREDGARAEEVRRERRHGADDRIVDRARLSPRPADSRRAGRAGRRRRRAAAAAREVLHPGHRFSRRASTRRIRSPTAWTSRRWCSSTRARRSGCSRRRRSKGVKPVAWFDSADAAAQRLGVGPAVSRSGGRDRRRAGRQGPRRAVRPRGRSGARSRTARSSCCSTASTTAAPRRGLGVRGRRSQR